MPEDGPRREGLQDARVFAVKCADYETAEVKLPQLIEMAGGIAAYAAPGETIALKPNLLMAAKPEKAVTTHPAVVAAVGRMLRAAGAAPLVAESPGGGYKYDLATLRRTYRVCGLTAACGAAGVGLSEDTTFQAVSYPEGKLIKRFEVITPILEADGVVNLCKLKTHMFMHMTGAVKNSFGAIPGRAKPGYHATLHDTMRFADMLLDLSNFVAPRLSIMDAVVGMEGEGPNAGEPRFIGLLLAARNPLALDVVAGEIMGIGPQDNPLLVAAQKRGLGPTRLADVDLIGIAKDGLRSPGFKLPATLYGQLGLGRLPWYQRLLIPLFKDGMSVKPRIDVEACIACGVCAEACPMGAINVIAKAHAAIDEAKCIRCYCCHEMCPNDAVALHRSLLYRLVNR